jgi:hypothetical protein
MGEEWPDKTVNDEDKNLPRGGLIICFGESLFFKILKRNNAALSRIGSTIQPVYIHIRQQLENSEEKLENVQSVSEISWTIPKDYWKHAGKLPKNLGDQRDPFPVCIHRKIVGQPKGDKKK